MTKKIKSKLDNADATFFVAARNDVAHAVYERGEDGYLRNWHEGTICKEAADRLRADLEENECSLLTNTVSSGHDLSHHVAQTYNFAVRIAPHIGTDNKAWRTALRIADARPWKVCDPIDDIPF